jgi:hypothetical protein
LIAFGAFWVGLLGMTTDAVAVPAPPLALMLTLGGGVLCVLLLFVNLLGPACSKKN